MNISVSIKGGPELVAKLKRVSDSVAGNSLENAAASGALLIQNEAKETLKREKHWVTGNLARSLHIGGHSEESELANSSGTDIGGNKNDRNHAEVLVGTNVIYGPPLEFGTRYHPPYPFLRPSMDTKAKAVAKEIGEALKILLGKI